MSGGQACKCDERKKPIYERQWIVFQRNCNHSAFSGYRWTASDYSGVYCKACRAVWRTRADYVRRLDDGTIH